MSATRMLVLGVIRWAGPAHGYQVRAELMSWRAGDWARIKPGSIYHAIRKAAADGLLAEVDTGPGQGPDRVTYRITDRGVGALHELVREGLGRPRDPWMLNAALALLPVLGRDEAVRLLTGRIAELERSRAELAAFRADVPHLAPEHVEEQARLWQGQVTAELEWALGLVERLRSGRYAMADDDIQV